MLPILRPITRCLAIALALAPLTAAAETSPEAPAEAPAPSEAPAAPAQEDAATSAKREAKLAMESWLQLIEEGKFIESWRAASPQFQQSIGAGRWSISCRNRRRPTGPLLGRELSEQHYHTEYYKPNGHLAEGEMVTFVFTTRFEHLKEASEVVVLQPFDNTWKVVSYSLKPKIAASEKKP